MQNDSINNSLDKLEDRWQHVYVLRQDLAAQLDRLAREDEGTMRRRLTKISKWFRGDADFEDALRRPEVLAICLPLLSQSGSGNADTEPNARPTIEDLPRAIGIGLPTLSHQPAAFKRVFRLLRYPLLLMTLLGVLGVAFSFYLAPTFEAIFLEFGIELPLPTTLLLGLATLTRQFWWVAALVILSAVVSASIMAFMSRKLPFNASWLDRQTMSTRCAVASWTWHVALLLRIGLSQSQAISTAGGVAAKAWLRNHSKQRTEETATNTPFFSHARFPLVGRSLELPPSTGKTTMLQQAAIYYWDRDRSVGDWWLKLLANLILWNCGALVLLTFFSLYFSMYSIFRALCGPIVGGL